MRQLVLPPNETVHRLIPDPPLTDEQYFAFCSANSSLTIERTASGELIVMAPAGAESAYRSNEVCRQLTNWALQDGRGVAFDSSVEFLLPTGAALSPDASWVKRTKLAKLTHEQLRRFPPIAPDFVVEVLSPSDRLPAAQAKMQDWLDAGVPLAWLIDTDRRTVYVYRRSEPFETYHDIESLAAPDPLPGFTLHLTAIWQGLRPTS